MNRELTKEQWEYLKTNLSKVKPDLLNQLLVSQEKNTIKITMSDDIADEIRDWAMERLDYAGFDIDYELTSEGKILEALIDVFYQ